MRAISLGGSVLRLRRLCQVFESMRKVGGSVRELRSLPEATERETGKKRKRS